MIPLHESSTLSTPPSHYNTLFSQNQFKEYHVNGVNHHSSFATTISSSNNLFSMYPISYYKLADDNESENEYVKWTAEEDSILVESVGCFELKEWSHIASFLDGKNEKQCRERWYTYLRPDIKDEPWSKNEETILLELQKNVVENNWTEIVKRFPGRTESSVKNRWNAIERVRNAKNNSINMANVGNQLNVNISDVSSDQCDYEMEFFPEVFMQQEIDFMKKSFGNL